MVFTKYSGNPVLGPQAFPGDIMYVFNPGAIRYNGEYLLIVDAATAATPIVFWIARSRDGIHFTPDPKPISGWPAPESGAENCIYDPRITFIDGEYILMYASQAPGRGVRTGVVRTRDFRVFERIEQAETGRNNRNSSCSRRRSTAGTSASTARWATTSANPATCASAIRTTSATGMTRRS